MSIIPQFHRGGLSAVSCLLDNYENMFSNLGQLQTYAPSFDVRETETSYYLDGDLPGVQEKELEIEIEDEHCLKIKAHSEREYTTEKDSWLASERSLGDFWRTFNFPTAIDQDHTHAHLKNGVLSLEVPKSVKKQTKKKVNIGD
jgi:HSP20 family protein